MHAPPGERRLLQAMRKARGRARRIAAHHARPVAVEIVGNEEEGQPPGAFATLALRGIDSAVEQPVQFLQ